MNKRLSVIFTITFGRWLISFYPLDWHFGHKENWKYRYFDFGPFAIMKVGER